MKRFLGVVLIAIFFSQMIFTAEPIRAADDCQWSTRPDDLRAIYQPYNQRLIMMNSKREAVQVVEEGLITPTFQVVSYAPNCRYLVGAIPVDKRFTTIIWDLESTPPRRVAVFENSFRDPYQVDWSPDSAYAVVSGRESADLLRLSDANRVRLTNKIISDCHITTVGCAGNLYAFDGLYWHPELNQLHMTLTDGNVAVIDLNNGQPIDFWNRQGEPLPSDKASILREQMASPYGCSPTVQYQTYNERLVLKSVTTGELVNIVQAQIPLKQYRFLSWSPNCNYIAAVIDEGQGLVTAIWDTRNDSRVAELPYTRETRYSFDWSSWAH